MFTLAACLLGGGIASSPKSPQIFQLFPELQDFYFVVTGFPHWFIRSHCHRTQVEGVLFDSPSAACHFVRFFLSFNPYFLTSGCSLAPTNVVSPALGLGKRVLSMALAWIQRKNVALHKASCICSEGASYKRQRTFALKDISHK